MVSFSGMLDKSPINEIKRISSIDNGGQGVG